MAIPGPYTAKAEQLLTVTEAFLLALFFLGGVQIHSPRPLLST
jgi:hypothetical protein